MRIDKPQGAEPLSPANRGQKAYEQARKDGVGGYAIDYWDGAAKQAKADLRAGKANWMTANATVFGASVMGFFARLSGVSEIEGRWAQNKVLWNDKAATAGDRLKAGGWLTLETGMAALNFTGLGGIAKGLARRQAAKIVAQEGAEITARLGAKPIADLGVAAGAAKVVKGMLPATPEAAAAVRADLSAVISKLPTVGKLTAKDLETLQKGLAAIGSRNGIEIVFKAGPPQVLTEPGKIVVWTSGASWHEMLHVVQTVQTQATAMTSMAQRLHKTVAQLSAEEMREAYLATVKTLETQGYAQFEEQAFKAVGAWGSKLDPARYVRVLQEGLGQFERALVTGRVPETAPGIGAKAYGQLTKLGESQGELALNLSPIWAWVTRRLAGVVEPSAK